MCPADEIPPSLYDDELRAAMARTIPCARDEPVDAPSGANRWITAVFGPGTATASRPSSQPNASTSRRRSAGRRMLHERTPLGAASSARASPDGANARPVTRRAHGDDVPALVADVVDDRAAASAHVGEGERVGPPRGPHRAHRAVDHRVVDPVSVDDVQDEAMPRVDDVRDPEAVRRPRDRDDLAAGGDGTRRGGRSGPSRRASCRIRRRRRARAATARPHVAGRPCSRKPSARGHREPPVDDRRDAVRFLRQRELRRRRWRLRLRAEADVQRAGRGERAGGDHQQDDRRREGEDGGANPAAGRRHRLQRAQRAVQRLLPRSRIGLRSLGEQRLEPPLELTRHARPPTTRAAARARARGGS